jgi:glucose-6-phosphate 1-dehydrogenase
MADPPREAPPSLMTIFGASGDLTKRLLLPSIYNLAAMKALPEGFHLLGVARQDWSDDQFRDYVAKSLKEFWGPDAAAETIDWLTKRTSYVKGNFDDAALFDSLKGTIEKLEQAGEGSGNRMFYLAVAPSFICSIAANLSYVGLLREDGEKWRRLVIEKPFGHDHASAKKLSADLQKSLHEDQIYRIDHFAGKDAVQDLTVFRFSNAIFESFWNRANIENVQITAAEIVGVEGRAGYYETSGALRDMVPNHLAEILSLVAMEPPVSFNAIHMREKQTDVLESIKRISPAEVDQYAVRGQYGNGSINGKAVPAYRSEKNVKPDSDTDTYVAVKVFVDNWRWAGVPFYLRTGKRMTRAVTEVVMTFKQAPARLFPGVSESDQTPNRLFFSLGHDQGIQLRFGSKAPGLTTTVQDGSFNFKLPEGPFGDHGKGYERLLHDVMLGDATLFPGADFIEQGWQMVQPLLDAWREPPRQGFPNYAAGSAGPRSSDDLLAQLGHTWHSLEQEQG